MKDHFKGHFMNFFTIMHKDKGKDDMIKDYFNYGDYYIFFQKILITSIGFVIVESFITIC